MNPDLASAILQMLRDARALVYRDAESFGDAMAILEHIGQLRMGEVGNGLGAYEKTILSLAREAPGQNERELQNLFQTVRDARNDSVHTGDFIRHHVLRLVELLLILEEALMVNSRVASDLMVRNPVTAELWHNIATVRRNMLSNSFSYLPIRVNNTWGVISDVSLMVYLSVATKKERGCRLGATVEAVINMPGFTLYKPRVVFATTPVDEIKPKMTHLPILVVDSAGNLLGILTAFDLL